MNREIVEKKVEALEKRVRWQMRAIIGLIIIFLFNTSPAFTSKWFHRLLPPKLTSINVNDTDFRDIASHREEILARRIHAPGLGLDRDKTEFINNILSHQNGTPRLGKQAQAGELQILSDTLRVQNTTDKNTADCKCSGGRRRHNRIGSRWKRYFARRERSRCGSCGYISRSSWKWRY